MQRQQDFQQYPPSFLRYSTLFFSSFAGVTPGFSACYGCICTVAALAAAKRQKLQLQQQMATSPAAILNLLQQARAAARAASLSEKYELSGTGGY
jgi:hypothetical protein